MLLNASYCCLLDDFGRRRRRSVGELEGELSRSLANQSFDGCGPTQQQQQQQPLCVCVCVCGNDQESSFVGCLFLFALAQVSPQLFLLLFFPNTLGTSLRKSDPEQGRRK